MEAEFGVRVVVGVKGCAAAAGPEGTAAELCWQRPCLLLGLRSAWSSHLRICFILKQKEDEILKLLDA